MIKCAIFDLDGTLVDSMEYWTILPIEYAKRNNLKIDKNLPERFLAMSITESALYFRNHLGLLKPVETITKELNDIMEVYYMNNVEIKAGISRLLEEFDARGIKMAVASATDKYLIIEILQKLNILKYFPFILTSSEVGSSKKNPKIYLDCAAHFNIEPKETIVFEDLPYGLKSSKNVGFITVGIYDEPSKKLQKEIKKYSDYYFLSFDSEAISTLNGLTSKD